MKRHQQILAGVLALQVILSVFVFWPRQTASGAGEPLFPNVTADDVVGLTVTDNMGQQVVLKKEGGTWVLPNADNYPAEEDTVTPVIDKLVNLQSSTVVARTDASQAQLQVTEDTYQRRLDFETQAGDTYTVYLGSAPRYTATNFRVDGSPEIYLTTELTTWEINTAVSGWIDTSYVSIDESTVTGAVLQNANGTFAFAKDGSDWTLADLQPDETVAAGKTSAIVRNASSLTMLAPLSQSEDPSYGMDSPNAVVTLQTDDGVTHMLTVGASLDDGSSYVVKSSDSPYYVSVSKANVSAMVENARTDFLSVPPTPTPTPAP
jgi:hypothetical protein